ncbi:MAG TPA: T9SS type A sorting domain-containing protein [Bacteroidota bacterium]|nr:T9SS type A sorting domain-containing protein [Bacteroidota bacterium]
METHIWVNPTNSKNLIGTAITDEGSQTKAIGCYYSTDGGITWGGTDTLSQTFGGADPIVAFDPDGVAYLVYQIFDDRSVYIKKSTDGGASWSLRQIVKELSSEYNIDKPWLAISPVRNINQVFDVFVSYSKFYSSTGESVIEVVKSSDSGSSFSSLASPSLTEHEHGTYVIVDRYEKLYLAWAEMDPDKLPVRKIHIYGLADGGSTFEFEKSVDVSQIGSYGSGSSYFVKTGTRADCFPRLAVDPITADLYVAWANKQSGTADIVYLKATRNQNGSLTWGSNVTVDGSSGDQWMPAISIDVGGVISVLYYSTSGPDQSIPIYSKFRYSTNGFASFTETIVGESGGFTTLGTEGFVGDYHGLFSRLGKAYALWMENTTGNVRKTFFRELTTATLIPQNYQLVTMDQKDVSSTSFGKLGRWNQGAFSDYSAGESVLMESNTTEVIRALQAFKSGSTEKHNTWNTDSDVKNHRDFSIQPGVTQIRSQFNSASNATIQTSLTGGSVEFRDPWYIDLNESPYGMRNRGHQDAAWYSQASFDLSTGQSHQGVFLNQSGPPAWTPPYYSVRALNIQQVQGQSYHAFFQGWTKSGATLQDAGPGANGYDSAAVVFTSSGASITANYSTTNITTSVTIPAGTYTMAGTVTVASGATLTLSPGTTLQFPNGSKLVVNGVLVANGLSGQRITFTKSGSSWTGLEFSGSSANGSSLTYCTISYATEPVKVTNVSSFTMDHCTVDNANFSSNGALQFYGSNPTVTFTTIQGQGGASNGVRFASSSTGLISSSTIKDLGAGNGIVIQGNSSPRIQSNSIRNNFYHGVVASGNGTGCPVVISNSIQNNGSPSAYGQIVVYNSNAPRVGSNALRGGIFTVYCENYASVTTNWTGDYEAFAGQNSVYTNLHGIRANNHSTIYFGDYNFTQGSPHYYGACNKIDSSTQLKASSVAYSYILAEGNWWGVYPVPPGQLYVDGTSYLYADYALQSQNCPEGGGGEAVAAAVPTPTMGEKTAKLETAVAAFLRGDHTISKDLYSQIIQESTEERLRVRAMVGLLELSRTANDVSIVPLVESYTSTEGELGLAASEVLMGMYAATNRFAECENVALNIAQKYPNSENEKNALLCLATLKWFDVSQKETSDKYLAELLTKHGSSIDDATLAILGISKVGLEGSVTASATTGSGQLEISNFPNPFNPSTTISFVLPEDGNVTLKVYDLLGRAVAELVNGTMKAGSHETMFDASKLPSGVYFYKLDFGGKSISKKFVLTK